jgi:glycosyltransferase involved in cell wall biosynthesis
MRVLFANKFYYERGGLERVMLQEMEWLEAGGHEVAVFSTAHPENLPARFSRAFPAYRELGEEGRASISGALSMFWNKEAAAGFGEVLDEWQPDIVHCHGIHRHLSPSVLREARLRGIATVLTAHDYFLICPASTLLRGGTEPCVPRACGRRTFFSAARYRCVQGSTGRSLLAGAELTVQRTLGRYERYVDLFVTPSAFTRSALVEGGLPPERIRVVPNAVSLGPARSPSVGSDVLLIGRMSSEKGVAQLLEAGRAGAIPLVLAGDGPLLGELETRYASGSVRFLGRVDKQRVDSLIRTARAIVVPSIWLENAPMAVLEAMGAGTAVIASRIGGIPELFEDGVEGLLVPPGDVDLLARAMRTLADDAALARHMGEAGRARAAKDFSPEKHLEGLRAVYSQAIEIATRASR